MLIPFACLIRRLPDITSVYNACKVNNIRTKFTDSNISRTLSTDLDMKKDKSELGTHYLEQIMRGITGEKETNDSACRGRHFFRRAEFDTPFNNT